MPISETELLNTVAPFHVKWDGKRGRPIGKPAARICNFERKRCGSQRVTHCALWVTGGRLRLVVCGKVVTR